MYYVCKRDEWHPDNSVQGSDGFHIEQALMPLWGQRVSENELRFALAVVEPDLREPAWEVFMRILPQLVAARRIDMDRVETKKIKVAAAAKVMEVLQPLRELMNAEIMGRLSEVSRNWGIDGLEYGVAKIAEKRLVASVLNMAKDEQMCVCGHSQRHHRSDRTTSMSPERPCRMCNHRNPHDACMDFKSIRDFGGY